MFLLNQINVSPFAHSFDIISSFAAELEEPEIGTSGKGLIQKRFDVERNVTSAVSWCRIVFSHAEYWQIANNFDRGQSIETAQDEFIQYLLQIHLTPIIYGSLDYDSVPPLTKNQTKLDGVD